MEISFLPAAYGDAILIKTVVEGNPYTIVIDGGPEDTEEYIAKKYIELGHIDLMTLTHFDEDHIMGLIKYVEQYKGGQLPVDAFWCNCAQKIDLAAGTEVAEARYEHANTLAGSLREQKKRNPDFNWTEDINSSMPAFTKGDLRIDILSPSADVLKTLREGYDEYALEHAWIDSENTATDIALVGNNPNAAKTIDELAAKDTTRTVNLWNKASMAFMIQAEGKKILMLGDADADIVADSLEALIGKDSVIDIDLVKLSHHGSKHNISKRLLKMIRCNDYVISTNGGAINFCHPDRKTLALILRNDNRDKEKEIRFYFNYPLNEIQSRTGVLLSKEEMQKENCNMIEQATITL